MADRKLWSWGDNTYGQLGLGDVAARSSPEQVGALTTWQLSDGGSYHTLSIKTDGSLWSCGQNSTYGQLGLGDLDGRSSPVQVGLLTTWTSIFGGNYFTLATKIDGTLWSWGQGGSGQLGLEDTANRSSPEQVGALTSWDSISCGSSHVAATSVGGALWSWGYNNYGNLGVGNTVNRSSPTQVGVLNDWSIAACGDHHIIAVKTNGTLWTWGYNWHGQLGHEDAGIGTNRSSPEQVGTLKDWYSVTGGYSHSVALKIDGTIWAWGYNAGGELGMGNTVYRSSPEQIGSLTDWSSITTGWSHVLATKTNGTLWVWGDNAYGQLGLEDEAHRSSPEQVGALTVWSLFKGTARHSVGIQGPIEIEDVVITLSRGIGEWCWGHITDVEEANIETLSEGTGTGIVSGTGDAEHLTLLGGETWTLPAIQTGLEEIEIEYDKYENQGGAGAGSGGPGLIEYRTGATQGDCEAAGWNTYTVHFTSLDWVQVRVSNFN